MKKTLRLRGLFCAIYTFSLVLTQSASSHEVLRGIWPTCRDPLNVKKAHLVSEKSDEFLDEVIARPNEANVERLLQFFDAVAQLNCAESGASGVRVQTLRCAANVTPKQDARFARPVPRDDELPEDVCEVEAFFENGQSGLYYTFYFNIEQSP